MTGDRHQNPNLQKYERQQEQLTKVQAPNNATYKSSSAEQLNLQEYKAQNREEVKQEPGELTTFKEKHKRAMAKRLALFRKSGGSISPCSQPSPEWKKLSIAVDSGACENVIDATEEVPDYPIAESKASRIGVT